MNGSSIALLGSTGSIGIQTTDVVRSLGRRISVLSAHSNIKLIEEQIREFNPAVAVMTDDSAAKELKIAVSDTDTKVYSGANALCAAVEECDCETVVNAVVGFAGLAPSVSCIKSGKRLALANKESLVAGGSFVTQLARNNGVEIFPIDSEHSAIFQCMLASSNCSKEVEKVLLTGSGGPFRGKGVSDLEGVTPQEAINHPTWNMGRKISVDSATLMNKGLEVIEAVRLFDITTDDIEVVIHKESIVHSLVRFRDKSIIAQMSYPDMKLPISYALTYPERVYNELPPLDLTAVSSLTFEKPDTDTFKCLKLAYRALEMGGNATAALNGANEVAVERFLNLQIGFLDIPRCVEAALDAFVPTEATYEGVLDADRQGRSVASSIDRKHR